MTTLAKTFAAAALVTLSSMTMAAGDGISIYTDLPDCTS